MLVVFPDSDNPVRPLVMSFEEQSLRVPIAVWPDEGINYWEMRKRGIWWAKLYRKLKENIALMFANLINPNTEKVSVKELAKRVLVRVNPNGSVHAKIIIPPGENAENLLRFFGELKKYAKTSSYGFRKLFDKNVDDYELKEQALRYIKRSNLFFADRVYRFAKYLIKRGLDPDEAIEAVKRLHSVLKAHRDELERKRKLTEEEVVLKQLIDLNLPKLEKTVRKLEKRKEKEIRRIRRELREKFNVGGLRFIPRPEDIID